MLAQKTRNSTNFPETKLSVTFLLEKVKPKSLEEKQDEYRDRLGHLYHRDILDDRDSNRRIENQDFFHWEVSLYERTVIWVLDENTAVYAFWELRVWKLLSAIIINILGIFSLSWFRKKKWFFLKIPRRKKLLTGAFLKAAKQVVLRAWLCISRAVNNISTSQHFTSLTIPKEQNPLIFNGWVSPPPSRQLLKEPMMQSLSGSFGRRTCMKSSSIKRSAEWDPDEKKWTM